MNDPRLAMLRCPNCGGTLRDGNPLVCSGCSAEYPLRDGIPRFVPAENYAANFGFQWNRFRTTQLDSRSGLPISRNRFVAQLGQSAASLRGKRVLDAGCGAGRFAEIALSLGADLVAIDYSSAVDAAAQNLGEEPFLVQADIYRLPFAPGSFDVVYSLGVLQHTPDPRASIEALARMIRPGGQLVVDIYRRSWTYWIDPKYRLRPITRRMSKERLFALVERLTPPLLRLGRGLSGIPVAGRFLRRLVPVANYEGRYPLSAAQLQEWAILDTFDWFSPRYDFPQTAATLKRWLETTGLEDVEVGLRGGSLTGWGRRGPDAKIEAP